MFHSYPAQEKVGGDAKIPSIILYDSTGAVRAVGAEAILENNIEQARDEEWLKAEWYCIVSSVLVDYIDRLVDL
jgi:hypothetical protein